MFRGLLSSEFRRNLYGNKIFKKILTENALEYLTLWRDFLGIALQARHLNENLENNLQLESFSVSSVCSVDFLSSEFRRIFWVAYG